MERCVFCGWNRRTAFPSIRFFMIPRDPGMKQMMWLHAIAKREWHPRDRVCSVHFRSGRPSNDPSHEDFVPHLYLTCEPPPETILYLEELAESRSKSKDASQTEETDKEPDFQAHVNPSNPTRLEVNKVARPSILRRKRKPEDVPRVQDEKIQKEGIAVTETNATSNEVSTFASGIDPFASVEVEGTGMRVESGLDGMNSRGMTHTRRVKLQQLHRNVVAAAGVRPGQIVIIKRRVIKKKSHEMNV